MSSSIHLTNAKGRDATVGMSPVKAGHMPLNEHGTKKIFERFGSAEQFIKHYPPKRDM